MTGKATQAPATTGAALWSNSLELKARATHSTTDQRRECPQLVALLGSHIPQIITWLVFCVQELSINLVAVSTERGSLWSPKQPKYGSVTETTYHCTGDQVYSATSFFIIAYQKRIRLWYLDMLFPTSRRWESKVFLHKRTVLKRKTNKHVNLDARQVIVPRKWMQNQDGIVDIFDQLTSTKTPKAGCVTFTRNTTGHIAQDN